MSLDVSNKLSRPDASSEEPRGDAVGQLRRKWVMADWAVKDLLASHAQSRKARPDTAGPKRWDGLQRDWHDYFLSQGAVAHRAGDIRQSLQNFKSAIQIAPANRDGFAMYRHAFNELNEKAIGLFNAHFSKAQLMVAHVSCASRLAAAQSSMLSFEDPCNEIQNIAVIGNSGLRPSEFRFDPASQVLEVPASDDYEGLPEKVRQFLLFVGSCSPETPVLKVDDDIHCDSLARLKSDLENEVSAFAYGGRVFRPGAPLSACTFWHLNKCSDAALGLRPDSLLNLSPYVAGPYYWLGKDAINLLYKAALINERYFESEIYEDRAIGTVLGYYGIDPYHFSLIESGALRSLDS